MATCGYVCPKCDGNGFVPETLLPCDWCMPQVIKSEISTEDWIKTVHENNCCSDIEKK